MSKSTKTIVSVNGYVEYVLELRDAVQVLELLGTAEVYKSEYVDGKYVHSISPRNTSKSSRAELSLRILTDSDYRLYKLAGEANTDD